MELSVVAQHRALITSAIDPTLVMHRFRQKPGLLQYVGLLGTWLKQDGEPSSARVLFATVREGDDAPRDDALPLDRLPWIVLQLQTLHANSADTLWSDVRSILRSDMVVVDGDGCNSTRITFDPKQRNENVRGFKDEEVLQAYKIHRVDDGAESDWTPAVRPAVSIGRERVCYRVHNVIDGETVRAPLSVFLEKVIPKQRMLWQRLQREAGYVRDGDLRGALGEAKTWIVLED